MVHPIFVDRHNDIPLSEPPGDLEYVSDINTGAAYLESYKKYVKIPGKQVLLPVIFYIDEPATSQFSDLPITAVKFTQDLDLRCGGHMITSLPFGRIS
jgi:hypothetical protein